MGKMVFDFLIFIGVVMTIVLFLYFRSPHSDVVSFEMHEIDAPAPSTGI
jgi:hypothetical protein